MKNEKMNLASLKVKSFIIGISESAQTVKGGAKNTLMNCSQRCTNPGGECTGLDLCASGNYCD